MRVQHPNAHMVHIVNQIRLKMVNFILQNKEASWKRKM